MMQSMATSDGMRIGCGREFSRTRILAGSGIDTLDVMENDTIATVKAKIQDREPWSYGSEKVWLNFPAGSSMGIA